jgi:hypothetical protein
MQLSVANGDSIKQHTGNRMSLPLKETQTLAEISEFLYSFLPGQAHPFADQRISFAGIARELGLGKFWQGGSKQPAINALLENTLDLRREKFCPLIVEIVRRGIKYRGSKGSPIMRENILSLNKLILEVGFKIPELWDESFLASLPREPVEQVETSKKIATERLKELRDMLLLVEKLPPQQKGFEFEHLLNELFDVFGLQPRGSFRLQGEQIDGSLDFENHTYLIEAKFQTKPVGQEDLLVFRGKVEGKATWSRGIFISISGFTQDGLAAFSRGRPTNLIAIDGQDLYFILGGQMPLDEAIRLKARRAAETGEVMVSVQQLLLES